LFGLKRNFIDFSIFISPAGSFVFAANNKAYNRNKHAKTDGKHGNRYQPPDTDHHLGKSHPIPIVYIS
jgi:hypothetical protein